MTGRDDLPAHADRARPSDGLLGRSLALVRFLRDGCPWDARQTPESLRPYLLEEAHETADAVLRGDDEELAGELGDLLLNVAFQIVLAEERGAFGAGEVVRRLEAKMEARHPHVYGDAEEPPDWEAMKARTRGGGPAAGRDAGPEEGPGPIDRASEGVRESPPGSAPPRGLEPLSRSLRAQQRAAGLGFDWPSAEGALAKLREEVAELEAVLGERGPTRGADDRPAGAAATGGTVPDDQLEEETGDVLFAAVAVARHASVHPMRALERAVRKFERRFRELVRRADDAGLDLDGASVEELEAAWREAKGEEDRDGPDGRERPDGS